MSSTVKFILVFLGCGLVMFLIFYFYPAELFEATAVGLDGTEVPVNLSLQGFIWMNELPSEIIVENVATIERKLAGWMIMFICLIGLPLMFAYRSSVDKEKKA